MNGSLQQLKYTLQLLALPATAQTRLNAQYGCPASLLSQAFNQLHHILRADSPYPFTNDQSAALNQLDTAFSRMNCRCQLPDCSDLTLRTNNAWRQARELARQALVAFRWTLDLPPLGDTLFQQIKGDTSDDHCPRARQAGALPTHSPGMPRFEMVRLV